MFRLPSGQMGTVKNNNNKKPAREPKVNWVGLQKESSLGSGWNKSVTQSHLPEITVGFSRWDYGSASRARLRLLQASRDKCFLFTEFYDEPRLLFQSGQCKVLRFLDIRVRDVLMAKTKIFLKLFVFITWVAGVCARWSGATRAAEKEELLPGVFPRARPFSLLHATSIRPHYYSRAPVSHGHGAYMAFFCPATTV